MFRPLEKLKKSNDLKKARLAGEKLLNVITEMKPLISSTQKRNTQYK